MGLHDALNWLGNNWFNLLQWIGDVIAIDAVIKQVATKYGFTKLVSICDLIANDLNFVLDIITGILTSFKKQSSIPTQLPPSIQPTPTQKVD